MIAKSFTIDEVFNNTLLSLNFEFISSKNPNKILEDLGRAIGKKITLTEDNDVEPIWSNAILFKEYNSKKPKYNLKLDFQDFPSLNGIITETLNWLNKNAELNESTLLESKLMFNHKYLDTIYNISNLNKGKLILQINEEEIYKRFPHMKHSPYALSIKNIAPFENLNMENFNINQIDNIFNLPQKDYYAIDFTDQTYGILNFKYIGGKFYAENPKNVQSVLEYYIVETYKVLNTEDYTIEMKKEFKKINEKLISYRKAFFDVNYFLNNYKNIKVSVDLNEDKQVIKTFWQQLRKPLFKLIIEGNFTKGQFNLDSDIGLYELYKATLVGPRVRDISLVKCEISGLLENCEVWSSKVKNSRVYQSTFNNNNLIENCVIKNTRVDRSNIINKSYIINEGEVLNCKINESVIKNATLGKNARIDEKSIVIFPNVDKKPKLNKGIDISEVRNYKWIKNLTSNNDLYKGFSNQIK